MSFSTVEKTNDRIYYNISIRPPSDNPSGIFPAEFSETRMESLLNNPSEYYLTLSRFSIPANNIPITIMDVIPNPSDPTDINYTPYSVTLVYNEVIGALITRHYYKVQVVHTSPNFPYAFNGILPNPPTTTSPQNKKNTYYWIYTYQNFLSSINNALESAFNLMKASHTIPQAEAPKLVYSASKQLISLVTPYNYTNTSTGTIFPAIPEHYKTTSITIPEVEIFTNDKLYNKYIEAIPVNFLGRNQPNGTDFAFVINALPFNSNAYLQKGATITIPPAYLEMEQEYKHLDDWNSLNGLVFTSSLLPINKENIQSNITSEGGVRFFPILTDFEPILNDAGSARGVMQYFPRGNYRVVNLNSHLPLKKINLKIYWKDKDGVLYPLNLTYGQELTVKMIFIKRKTYKN